MSSRVRPFSILGTELGVTIQRFKISDGSLLGSYAALLTHELRYLPRRTFCLLAEDAAAVTIHFGLGAVYAGEGEGSPPHGRRPLREFLRRGRCGTRFSPI